MGLAGYAFIGSILVFDVLMGGKRAEAEQEPAFDHGRGGGLSPQLAWRELGVGVCVASPVARVAGRREQAQPGGGTTAVCPAAAGGYSSLRMHVHTMAPCGPSGRVRTAS
jgi:hypothetical protein